MVSDADCRIIAVGPGFESRRRQGCKSIAPSRYGDTLSSRQAASPLGKLVEREERLEALDHLQGVLSQNWSEIQQIRIVLCIVLKAKPNDRHKNVVLSRV
ncbi:hypothetical protein TNCV_507111 [Trichonephila clavipes]|nr:hypothetical protein TNCV_507111 [Trichonephila clavipes]